MVIYTNQLDQAKRFYQNLGLRFVKELHEEGPIHYFATNYRFTLEIYSSQKQESTSPLLGFELEDLGSIQERWFPHIAAEASQKMMVASILESS